MDIGMALKTIAAERGIRNADICRALPHVSDAYLSMLFSSKIGDPQFSRVQEISEVLGVSLDYVSNLAKQFPNPPKRKK